MDGVAPPPGWQIDPEQSQQMGFPVAVDGKGGRMRLRAATSPGAGGVPPGATPRPDYGPGVYQSQDGAVMARGSRGGLQMLQGAQMATGDAKTRINLAIDPAVAAQGNMARSEGQGTANPVNPLNRDWGAAVLVGKADAGTAFDVLGKVVGGQDFQDYQQASKTFESSVIPIFSGAAVTPSEATRFIRANLPELGDTAQTLATKARNRAMILNSAAALTGKPKPFPDVPTWQESRLTAPAGGAPGGAATPQARAPIQSRIRPEGLTPQQRRAAAAYRGTRADSGSVGNPSIPATQQQYEALPPGVHYIGPDGQVRVKQ